MTAPLATHEYAPGGLDAAIKFVKRTRAELRQLRRVRVYRDKLQIFDINGDFFELRAIGYPDADIVPLLQMINTAYNPQTLHQAIEAEYKEFDTGRRYTWAHDRVM
jgi:hypothetical protein